MSKKNSVIIVKRPNLQSRQNRRQSDQCWSLKGEGGGVGLGY